MILSLVSLFTTTEYTFLKSLLSLSVTLNLELEHMDVKSVFLHGDLEKKICMKQLDGVLVESKKDNMFQDNSTKNLIYNV